MDSELERVLDHGLRIVEKYSGGEYQGTDYHWKSHLEAALEDYWRRRLGVPKVDA